MTTEPFEIAVELVTLAYRSEGVSAEAVEIGDRLLDLDLEACRAVLLDTALFAAFLLRGVDEEVPGAGAGSDLLEELAPVFVGVFGGILR